MIALPQPPTHLLTVAEYAQLSETTTGYTELQERNLVRRPDLVVVDYKAIDWVDRDGGLLRARATSWWS